MSITTVCRRCRRPLTSPLAVAAGVGGRCALLDLVEGVGGLDVPYRGPGAGGVPVLRAAIAITTAVGAADVTVRDLVGDLDPLDVAAALGHALSVTLRAAVGEDGRRTVLRDLGLDAAGAVR